jgi:hypothetical protein
MSEMDDDSHDTGLGGLAWYQLGRMSAESDRVRSDAVDAVLSRRRPQLDVQSVVAQNQVLAAENARLRQELAAYKLNFNNLRAWADSAEKTLERLGALRD